MNQQLKRGGEKMAEINRNLRYRVNVSQTSTGKKSFDCTVDGEGYSQDEILILSDSLVRELERRYPILGREI